MQQDSDNIKNIEARGLGATRAIFYSLMIKEIRDIDSKLKEAFMGRDNHLPEGVDIAQLGQAIDAAVSGIKICIAEYDKSVERVSKL